MEDNKTGEIAVRDLQETDREAQAERKEDEASASVAKDQATSHELILMRGCPRSATGTGVTNVGSSSLGLSMPIAATASGG